MKTKAVPVYLPTSGNTKQIAILLAKQISDWADVTVLPIDRAENNPELVTEASLVGFGAPVFHLGLAERVVKFVELNARSRWPAGKSFFLFCTYAGISSGLALFEPAQMLRRAGHVVMGALKVKAPHFYQPSRSR